MKKLFCIIIAVIMLATGVTGCAGNNTAVGTASDTKAAGSSETSKVNEKDLPVLKVALMPFMLSLSAKYVTDKGWDKENGFKVENITFSMGAPMNEALGANQWDLGTIGAAAIFSVASYNAKLVADLDSSDAGIELYARPDDPMVKAKGTNPTYPEILGSPETVKGKSIICEVGTVYQMMSLKWLEKLGLKANDAKITHMTYAQGWQAFQSGQGDVVALGYPLSYEAQQKGYIKVGGLTSLGVPYNDVLVANEKSYDAKKDLIIKYVSLLYKANDEIENDKEGKKALLKKWYTENGQDVDDKAVELEALNKPFITTDKAKTWKHGESTKLFAEFMVSIGKLQAEKLPIYDKNLVSGEILGEALK